MQAVTLQRQLREALQRGDHQAAIVYLDQAVELAREAGDQATEGRYLGNLALLYHRMGYVDDAMRCFQQALELVRAEDDRMTESGLLGNMGNVLREVGQCEQAIAYLNEALDIAKTIGDVRGRGIWLSNLGLVYDDLGQADRAVEYHSQSIVVARQLHDQRGLATRLRKLSDSFLATGNVLEALKCLGEALTIYTAIGDQQELLSGLIASASIHRILADHATTPAETQLYARNALEYYQHALTLARAGDNPQIEREIKASMQALALPHPQPLSTGGAPKAGSAQGSRTK